jgi:pyruvate dehydrogenase E2 component (dihydrolipoamide acetyltransferase)
MAEVIRMPLLSDTMTEGKIAEWHKKVGDLVKSDDVLADVETDKATMEVMPFVSGTILYIGVEKGSAAKVNDIIAIIGKPGEDYTTLLDKPTSIPTPEPITTPEPAPIATTASAAPTSIPAGVTVIRMPLLSDTMTEGKIVSWNKQVGDLVKNDDVLAEVETDKATMEVMGYADGTLLHIGVPAGSAAKINEIIAIVGKAGTDIQGILAAATNEPVATNTITPPATSPVIASIDATPNHVENDSRLKISPLARKIANDKGIDLNQLAGSGDGGRIVKRDIDNYIPLATKSTNTSSSSSVVAPVSLGTEFYTDTPLSQMRKIIAARLAESKFTAPHFYLKISVAMDNAMDARKQINSLGGTKISFNDFIIKACAMALRKHPDVNSSWMGDFIRSNHHINIGSAIAVPEGLIVPVIRFADQLSLSQIASTASSLYDKARNKKIQPNEFTGNTFTISNLGMMGIEEFTAIINPPDSCILAVGNIIPTPIVENGAVIIRQMLKLTLSCDHRVVDGAVGAQFLQTLKTYLENPVTMLA